MNKTIALGGKNHNMKKKPAVWLHFANLRQPEGVQESKYDEFSRNLGEKEEEYAEKGSWIEKVQKTNRQTNNFDDT